MVICFSDHRLDQNPPTAKIVHVKIPSARDDEDFQLLRVLYCRYVCKGECYESYVKVGEILYYGAGWYHETQVRARIIRLRRVMSGDFKGWSEKSFLNSERLFLSTES